MFKILRSMRPLCLHGRHYSTTEPELIMYKEDEILFLGLNRPDQRNCINSTMCDSLLKAFNNFDQDDEAKICVLFGKGGNFCSGYDFKEVLDSQESKSSFNTSLAGLTHSYIKKPTIAAIDGYAVAGGLELALLCDLRVCDKDSVFGALNTRFNLPLIDGGSVRLPKIIGLSKALELSMTGRKVFSTEALSIGLVNEVVTVGAALGRAVSLARCIIKYNQESILADKKSMYYSTFEARNLQDGLDYEYKNGISIFQNNMEEGAKMFIDQKIGRHGRTNIHSIEELMERYKPKVI